MALILNLYSINKRSNSTKLPTGNGTVVEVNLKAPTSLIKPIFIIDGVNETYNYCKFEGRYYWIDDIIILSNDIMELHCSVDVLATYRSQILASTQYVLRSASNYDTNVVDSFYPAKTEYTSYRDTALKVFNYTTMSYIIGIIGNTGISGYNVGSIAYYWLSPSEMSSFINYLMSDDPSWIDIDTAEMSQGLQKALINPNQYIASCIALPLSRPAQEGTWVNKIRYGWYDIQPSSEFTCRILQPSDFLVSKQFTLPIRKHPQASDRGNYLNYSPYARYDIEFQPFGLIPLDTTRLSTGDEITINIAIDITTGSAQMNIQSTDDPTSTIAAYSMAQVGIPIQLSQLSVNGLEAFANIVNESASAASSLLSFNAAGAISSTTSAIVTSIEAQFPQVEKSGSNGSFIETLLFPTIHSRFTHIVDNDNEDIGRPLCQKKVLSTLSGFTMVRDADIELNATTLEIDQVKSYLMEGFFIE